MRSRWNLSSAVLLDHQHLGVLNVWIVLFAWWKEIAWRQDLRGAGIHTTYLLAIININSELSVSALPKYTICRADQALSVLTHAATDETAPAQWLKAYWLPPAPDGHGFTTIWSIESKNNLNLEFLGKDTRRIFITTNIH